MAATLAIAICVWLGATHAVTAVVVAIRFRRMDHTFAAADVTPFVTVLRPVRGLENNLDECLASSLRLSYPRHEIIFCCEDEDDPTVPVIRHLLAEHPGAPARLLVGRDRIASNPKLNNLAKGWRTAKGEFVVLSDSNTLLPPDYIESLLAGWNERTGLVSAILVVTEPTGFMAEVEAAYLNSYEARWMLFADAVGYAFAHGKTVMLRRELIDGAGGLAALDAESADELAATLIVRRNGLKVRLARRAIHQPLGRRSFSAVWTRQKRWAKLRRDGIPFLYSLEIMSAALIPFALMIGLAAGGAIPWLAAAGFIAGWYALEIGLIKAAGWPLSLRMPLAFLARDAIMPLIWMSGWLGGGFQWRGNQILLSRRGQKTAATDAVRVDRGTDPEGRGQVDVAPRPVRSRSHLEP